MLANFATSQNPDREKITFELSSELYQALADCAASAFKQDVSVSQSEIIRSALILSLPVFRENPTLIKFLNLNTNHGNQKNKKS